jgi:hypothetical protein
LSFISRLLRGFFLGLRLRFLPDGVVGFLADPDQGGRGYLLLGRCRQALITSIVKPAAKNLARP